MLRNKNCSLSRLGHILRALDEADYKSFDIEDMTTFLH